MSTETLLHHADGSLEPSADIFDEIYDRGRVGDWWWGRTEVDGEMHRVLWLVVPMVAREKYGPRIRGEGELIAAFPSHIDGNWALPGPVNGWDGNLDEPTFSPSIFVGGSSDYPGWHGFLRKGRLETV